MDLAKPENQFPTDVALKVVSSVFLYYLPTILLLKFLAPVLYGGDVNKASITQIEMTMMPALMIGVGMLSAQARSFTWKKLILRGSASFSVAVLALIFSRVFVN